MRDGDRLPNPHELVSRFQKGDEVSKIREEGQVTSGHAILIR
jgi:hypothetical protein